MDIIKTINHNMLKLSQDQLVQVSSEGAIQAALKRDDCLGFYAYEGGNIVGFALLREFNDRKFFLWNFIIDRGYQACGKGKEFLRLLINVLGKQYLAEIITTTYVYGNIVAKRLYESFGFIETNICYEEGIHEVNMELALVEKN